MINHRNSCQDFIIKKKKTFSRRIHHVLLSINVYRCILFSVFNDGGHFKKKMKAIRSSLKKWFLCDILKLRNVTIPSKLQVFNSSNVCSALEISKYMTWHFYLVTCQLIVFYHSIFIIYQVIMKQGSLVLCFDLE